MNLWPIPDVLKTATKILDQGGHFHQQFLCEHCGRKQTMAEEDKLFARGTCEECGKETNIAARGCNIMGLFGRGGSRASNTARD